MANRIRYYTTKVHLRGLTPNQGFVNLQRQVLSGVANPLLHENGLFKHPVKHSG
ncbi:hypothetical protein [aff. Roholtiella sp. LEGE 12411]|uniref:hypothetical protein n=1 Tax=aff. Roholtiella sp. LEGE 12411 TaxID=1828822 RepID=UPI00187F439A|nr:hypothetical protein [aff. Roholtiella sp. LEGE 12411]MBE9037085.1 hypothetical protein [aff. Roholtiella sp. LEGE 12411]